MSGELLAARNREPCGTTSSTETLVAGSLPRLRTVSVYSSVPFGATAVPAAGLVCWLSTVSSMNVPSSVGLGSVGISTSVSSRVRLLFSSISSIWLSGSTNAWLRVGPTMVGANTVISMVAVSVRAGGAHGGPPLNP